MAAPNGVSTPPAPGPDLFLVHQDQVNGPATHVIAIGVGAYPHLRDGTGALSDHHEGMGQLTSPPQSARAFCTWAIDELHDPNKPLSTVALLASERATTPFRNSKTGRDVQVQSATFANVNAALYAWKSSATTPDDRLVFFFCGHGLARGLETALLLEDYGTPGINPLDAAINFEEFHLAMDTCTAREQCFFVDACRSTSEMLLRAGASMGRPVFMPDRGFFRAGGPREAPIYYSTLAGQDAYSVPGEVSRFTGALLSALNGMGADDSEGDWRISTARLMEAVEWLMKRAAQTGRAGVQVPPTSNLTNFFIHYLKKDPEVPVFVACKPKEANDEATFRCSAGAQVVQQRIPSPGEWEVQLPVGQYEFAADFAGTAYRTASLRAYVRPPYRRLPPLEVGP